MRIDAAKAGRLLKDFDFRELFREQLGWDNFSSSLSVEGYELTGVAHKRGFAVYTCPSVPDSATRLKIYRVGSKTTLQQMIIYADQASGTQVWQWGRREGSTIAGLPPNCPPIISRVRRLFGPSWGVSFVVVVSCVSQFFPAALHSLRAAEKLSGFGSEVGVHCTAPASSAGQAVRATAELP